MRVVMVLALVCMPLTAAAYTLDFEDLADMTSLTDQYVSSGITFSGGTVLEAGRSLFEEEFPPHSGVMALLVEEVSLVVGFSSPVDEASLFATYDAPLMLHFYDVTGKQLGGLLSAYASNLGLSGEPGSHPNEFFSFVCERRIARMIIATDGSIGSFTLDDLVVHPMVVPEGQAGVYAGVSLLSLLLAYHANTKRLRRLCFPAITTGRVRARRTADTTRSGGLP